MMSRVNDENISVAGLHAIAFRKRNLKPDSFELQVFCSIRSECSSSDVQLRRAI